MRHFEIYWKIIGKKAYKDIFTANENSLHEK